MGQDVPVHAIWLAQDDPKKNTAVRLSRRGDLKLHERFNQLPRKGIILEPLCGKVLGPEDHSLLLEEGGALVGLDCSWAQIEDSVAQVMKRTKLKGRMLSGGQRRKVEIARTLICEPSIILLDEPFAGIDPIAVEEIKELLKEICKKNISILITDHNVRETLSLCHKAIILSEGSIIAEGNEKSLKENDHVRQKYFGKMFS